MEKQLLYLLDYDLRFNELEICKLFSPFMSQSTESSLSTRVSAVNKVAKAGKARAEAQHQSQMLSTPDEEKEPQYPSQAHLAPATPVRPAALSTSSSTTSALTSAVRGIARKLSTAHLRQPTATASMNLYASLSTDSSSSTASSSSDIASLVDDTGSCSSSSGWTSNESESDDETYDHNHAVGIVEPTSSSSQLGRTIPMNAALAGPGVMKKPFSLRPIPNYAFKNGTGGTPTGKKDATPTRARKVSDTSSIHTVTASPIASRNKSTLNLVGDPKKTAFLSNKPSSNSLSSKAKDHLRIPASSTMPSISAGPTEGFRQRSGTVAHRAIGVSTASRGIVASQSTSTATYSSTPTRGVGAIFSRMWGAAAANLKGGASSQNHSSSTEAELRPLVSQMDGITV